MRRRRKFADLRAALERHWRVRPAIATREERLGALELRPLEERRVLSASAALALAQALASSGIEQVEGTAKSPDPATPLGTDAAHHEPIDPGDRVAPGSAAQDNSSQDTKGPAADNAEETENRSVTVTAEVGTDASAASLNPAATPQAEIAAPAPLTLTVSGNQATNEGSLLAIVDVGKFTDPTLSSQVYSYSIDWGDGRPVDNGIATIDDFGGDGSPRQGSFDGAHIYADNGTYTVTVSLTNQEGQAAVGQFEVSVSNVAPTLSVVPNQVTTEGALLSITDIGKFTDPGFDNPLNVGGEVSEKFSYAIDWGDGTPQQSGPGTIDVAGGPGTLTQGSFNGSHTYADNGVYTVTVTINDDDGGMAVQTFEVTVANVAPTLVVPPNQVINEGALLSLTNIGQITDPGFDNPLNVGGEVTEKFTYSIDWGDGTAGNSGPVTIDVPGGPGSPTKGSFDGSHIYADNGVYTVTVTVNDDDGGSVVQTFDVVVNNVAPVLTVPPDQVVNEGAVLSITNIGQFTDPGFNNPLNIGGEVSEKFTYSIDWGDGTSGQSGPPTIDVVGGPGVATQGSFDGSHIYADNGVYTVTVTINDDDGGMAVQTFEVTVNNVAPTLVVPPNQVVNEGALLSITNIEQFTDPGFNNPLNVGGEVSEKFTYSINWGDGTPEQSGPPTIDVVGGPGVPTQGSFDGSHIYADNGVYTVTVTINDDDGGMAVQTFEVTVNNVAPTLVVPPNQVVNEGALLSIPNIGQFTDPGFNNPLNVGGEVSETFTYSIDWGDGTPPQSGPATIDVLGGPGVPTQGSFDGSHIYADNGVYTVTVTISDDDGGTTVQTFDVTVNNVAPTLVVPGDQVADEGVLLSVPNIGQFSDPGFDNPLNVGGEVTERFSYSIDWGDGSPLDSGPAPINIPGGPGVLTQGSFNGSHTYLAAGTYTVTVTLVDDDGGVAVGTFDVTVRNVAPILIAGPNQNVNEGAPLSVTNIGQFLDPKPGGAASYSYSIDWGDGRPVDTGAATIDSAGGEGPTSGSFDGAHTYADNGVYTVTISILTADGRSASTTLDVTVSNVAPTLVVTGNQSIPLGTTLILQNIGQFNDPGFDNPLNVGGETTERFSFTINWGDGTPNTVGPAGINQPGSQGVLTAGAFDAQHLFAAPGTFTVTVTLVDDDGGVAVGSFQVEVFVLRPPAESLFLPPGGGGTVVQQPPPPGPSDIRIQPQNNVSRIEYRAARIASVAGAEPRLVLRIVTPAGIEDRLGEEQLPDEVLDNLRALFKRLPDGHYRIYQIQPDGIERLVVDVVVQEGRSIELQEEPAQQDATTGDPFGDEPAAPTDAVPMTDSADLSPIPAVPLTTPALPPEAETDDNTAASTTLALAVGGVALVAPLGRSRRRLKSEPDNAPSLTKAHRTLRRPR
jgi:PKD repeat protein